MYQNHRCLNGKQCGRSMKLTHKAPNKNEFHLDDDTWSWVLGVGCLADIPGSAVAFESERISIYFFSVVT